MQLDVIREYLRAHYADWIDHSLPALKGKTPRQAAKTPRGRAQVDALLKDIENGTLAQLGGDAVDFAGMRRELGLE